ncbi:hypothetical protein BX070DRAFT_11257 [Coemansia spiralis]|nr:hypothetical protein BX070DRAFT_11257 [Coemansia spiralis]
MQIGAPSAACLFLSSWKRLVGERVVQAAQGHHPPPNSHVPASLFYFQVFCCNKEALRCVALRIGFLEQPLRMARLLWGGSKEAGRERGAIMRGRYTQCVWLQQQKKARPTKPESHLLLVLPAKRSLFLSSLAKCD